MTGTKSMLQSTTFRGLVLSFIAMIARQFELDFTYDDKTIDSIITIAVELSQVIGLLIAFYGRISATKKIN